MAEHVGRNVRDLRRAAGLTQGDLAGAMAEIGLGWHRGLVADVETGARELTVSELVALSAYFDLPVASIAAKPGALIGPNAVELGNRRLTSMEWFRLWDQKRDHTEPVDAVTRPAIDKITRGLNRPWARIWRKQGGEAPTAYQQAWEELVASRPLPGPTFITTEGPVGTAPPKPPWSQEVRIDLKPGVPFVARDEVEREVLERLEREGHVRRITPQQAYKLRRRKRKDT